MPAFNLKPTVSTWLHAAYPFGLLETPTIPSAMLNWNILLAFPLCKHVVPWAQVDFHPHLHLPTCAELGLLEQHQYDAELPRIEGDRSLAPAVQGILSHGFGAYLYLDYYYVKGSGRWKKRHFRHDFFIFAHDPAAREFHGATYTKQRNFGPVTVHEDALGTAVFGPEGRSAGCSPYYRRNTLVGYRANSRLNRSQRLDRADIKIQLVCYLAGTDLAQAPLSNQLVKHFCQDEAAQWGGIACGLAIYRELRAYYLRAAKHAQAKQIDRRITRLLWEHKKLMKIRLLRLVEEGCEPVSAILPKWDEAVLIAYCIHLCATAAKERNDPGLLISLVKDLRRLKALETGLIARLIKML